MNDYGSPKMSVIIVTLDSYDTIQSTIRHIQAQTVRDQLEVVVITPIKKKLEADDSALKSFLRFRVIEVKNITSVAKANAVGVKQASAPIVAFIEEHAYPESGWAEALIRAHQHSWAAVGPVVSNANPDSLISWADFLISYGQWMESSPVGIVAVVPGHNSSYKRDVLLQYGDELESYLEVENILHFDLCEKGYQLYLESEAKISHLNFTRLSPWLSSQYHTGRLFATARAQYWSFFRRIIYISGGPLIPVVRLYRILRQLNGPGKRHRLPTGTLMLTMLGLSVSALGEILGYTFGPGTSKQHMIQLEFNRTSK